jgi:hypothetical protein
METASMNSSSRERRRDPLLVRILLPALLATLLLAPAAGPRGAGAVEVEPSSASAVSTAEKPFRCIGVSGAFLKWYDVDMFFNKTFTLTYEQGDRVVIAGDCSGQKVHWVDDQLSIQLGGQQIYSFDYSNGCQGWIDKRAPVDISRSLHPGENRLRVQMFDLCGGVSGTDGVYLVLFRSSHIGGNILQGSAASKPYTPKRPAAHVSVEVAGRTADGKPFTVKELTDREGNWDVAVDPGNYKVTFPKFVCLGGRSSCVRSAQVSIKKAGDSKRIDAIAIVAQLEVTVTADPKELEIEQTEEGPVPKKVHVTVKVTNKGPGTVDHVTPPRDLIIGVLDEDAVRLMLGEIDGPAPPKLGSIKEGESKTARYVLEAEGDGLYEVSAGVIGVQHDTMNIEAGGKTRIQVGTPLLVFSARLPDDLPRLIKAGSTVLLPVKLENRSNVKKIVVEPIFPHLEGNAADGHLQRVEDDLPKADRFGSCIPSQAVELAPRSSVRMFAVIQTVESLATVNGKNVVGGTRGIVEFDRPVVKIIERDKSLTPVKPEYVLMADGSEKFLLHIDDSAPPTPPFSYSEYLGSASFGMWLGLMQAASGLIHGLAALPDIIFVKLPAAYIHYVNLELQLWDEVKSDPALRSLFFTNVGRLALVAYKHAPSLLGQSDEFLKKVNRQVEAFYTNIENEWYAGDWRQATTDMWAHTTDLAVNTIGAPIASCALPRLPQALTAARAAIAQRYARTATRLASFVHERLPATKAIQALKQTLAPGFELTNEQLRPLLGLTDEMSTWYRDYAQKNKLLITIRSRAAEAVDWIRKGAFLKPEEFKMKNVDWNDVKFLGYNPKDVGRLILKTPPTEEQFAAKLRALGVKQGTKEWEAARARYADRANEWRKAGGAKDQMLDYDRAEGGFLNWNWKDNIVNPALKENEPMAFGFRLKATGWVDEWGNRARAAEVNISRKGGNWDPREWRSITGDVDGVSLTHADGTPLAFDEFVRVMTDLRNSPAGARHGFTDSWTHGGRFDFATKDRYLFNAVMENGKLVKKEAFVEFGPSLGDSTGAARAVWTHKDRSVLIDAEHYYIWKEGGYLHQNLRGFLGTIGQDITPAATR